MSADDTWKAFVACWCQTYIGPPDYLRVDRGSNFVAKSFLTSAIAEDIHVLEAPVENPASMAHVELYHGPLRHVFDRMKQELPEESDKTILQYSIKAINDPYVTCLRILAKTSTKCTRGNPGRAS
jgi:hypothetical protein